MSNSKKILGAERRGLIINVLKNSAMPTTGKELAEKANVSRQVIVQDVSLLKASNEPIIATNRGYIYLQKEHEKGLHRRIIVCNHQPEETREELEIIVDHGVTVVDVAVEHPFYGDLTGSLMIKSRFDVNQFIEKITNKDTSLLLVLTDGVHIHTIEADSLEKIEAACEALNEVGYLVSNENP